MMSYRTLAAALLLCTLAAACGEIPTGSDTQAHPAGPSYDGGFGVGSGNTAVQSGGFGMGGAYVAEGDDGYVIGSGGATTADGPASTSTTTNTTSGDNAERGGYTMGSGG
jgi:hypothetical protein